MVESSRTLWLPYWPPPFLIGSKEFGRARVNSAYVTSLAVILKYVVKRRIAAVLRGVRSISRDVSLGEGGDVSGGYLVISRCH